MGLVHGVFRDHAAQTRRAPTDAADPNERPASPPADEGVGRGQPPAQRGDAAAQATDAALARYFEAQATVARPGLPPEDETQILGSARQNLEDTVRAELDVLTAGEGPDDVELTFANVDAAAEALVARYADDPAPQAAIREAVNEVRIDLEVEALREPIVSATDPAQVPALLDEALASASPQAQQRLLDDPDVQAKLDEAAAYINAPLDAIAEADHGSSFEIPAAVEESLQRLEELTRDIDPRIVTELTDRNLERLEAENEALQARDDLYDEEKGMFSPYALQVSAQVSDRMGGAPGSERAVERMADLVVGAYVGSFDVGIDAIASDVRSGRFTESLLHLGHGSGLFLAIADELRTQGDSLAADDLTAQTAQAVQSYVEQGYLNQAVDAYMAHTAELTWLVQNYGATMPPEALRARIEAYIAGQGPEWEEELNRLEREVAQSGAALLQQIEQLQALPPETRQALGIDETIASLLENPSAQVAISVVAGRHPEMLAGVDLPEAMTFLDGIGASQDIVQSLANAHVQTTVLQAVGQLDPNDPASVTRVRNTLDSLRGSEFAAAWGISNEQLDEVVDALEATIPGPGTTPAQAEAALAEYNRRLNGIEGFDQHSPLGQAFRGLGFGISVVGLAESVSGFVDDPSFGGGVQVLADSAGLLRDIGELGQGLGWISESNPLARLAANSTAGKLLGGVGLVFGTVGVLNDLGEGDLAQAGLGTLAVGGTALALFGSASWAGPVGWAVAAFATAGSLGLDQWRRSQEANEHENDTSQAFLAGSGLTPEAADTLTNQDSEGLSPVPALFEFGRIYGLTSEQTVAWLNDLQANGELDNLRQQVHGIIERNDQGLVEFTAGDAGELKAWIDENLDTPLPSDVTLESATVGENEVIWSVDAEGRPVFAEATLSEIPPTDPQRPTAETDAQAQARERGVPGDHGGHVIGYRFVGAQGLRNLFPQDGNFNVSAYKKLENEWADWTQHGMEVQIEVTLSPPGQDRPDEIAVSYQVVNPENGEVVYTNNVLFRNEAGQSFDRISYDEMPRYYT